MDIAHHRLIPWRARRGSAPARRSWGGASAGPRGLLRLLRARKPAQWLLSAACISAGSLMFLDSVAAGFLGLIAGLLLAADVLAPRPSLWLAIPAIAATGASGMIGTEQWMLVVGLLYLASVTIPLRRSFLATVFLTQTLFVTYAASFAETELTAGRMIPYQQLVLNLVVFNVIAGVGHELAAGRRLVEQNLEREQRNSDVLGQALARAKIMSSAIMAARAELDAMGVLRNLLSGAQQMSGANECQILLPAGSASLPQVRKAAASGARGLRVAALTANTGIIGQVVERREAVWLPEATRVFLLPGLPSPQPVRSLALAPVIVSGSVAAVLELGWTQTHDAPPDERELVTALTEEASIALERAALLAELAGRAEGSEALHRVAAGLAGRLDVVEIATEALTALRALYQADAGAFYLTRDKTTRSLVTQGLSEEVCDEIHEEVAGGRRGDQLREGRSLIVANVPRDRRLRTRELLVTQNIVTLVDVPALVGTRVVGGLVLYHHEARTYHPDEIQLLETFAQQLGGGIELAQTYRAIENLDRQREEFLSLVSHELRHPVAAVAAVAEGLANTPGLGEKEQRALAGLRQQAHSLARLAEDVLSTAQIEIGSFELRPLTFDLAALVSGQCWQSPEAERLEVETPGQPLMVEADPERIGQTVENLLSNALKYSGRGTKVCVTVEATTSEARVSVHDSGVGIDPEQIPHLFQKYGRLSNASGVQIAGVGLGLYLSRLLIEAHGGHIFAQSAGRGLGSTFTFTLPRYDDDEGEVHRPGG